MEDSSLEDSLVEPVCIDDVIFYGPITSYEEKVKHQFEKRLKERRARTKFLLPEIAGSKKQAVPRYERSAFEDTLNETVNQSSFYESFSLEDSRYGSFEDSLDTNTQDGNPKDINAAQFLSDQVRVTVRKTPLKQKHTLSSICDSLEDIHSLVSTAEKFSASEEIEDIIFETNVYEDSLKTGGCVGNKSMILSDQNYDEDSLAIFDDKNFDDSLEDNVIVPVLPSDNEGEHVIKNERQGHVEKHLSTNKNAFDTSIAIIYENVGTSMDVLNKNEKTSESIAEFPSTSDDVLTKDSLEIDKHLSVPMASSLERHLSPVGNKSERTSESIVEFPSTSEDIVSKDSLEIDKHLSAPMASSLDLLVGNKNERTPESIAEFPSTSDDIVSKDSLEIDKRLSAPMSSSLCAPDDPVSTSSSVSVYLSASEDLDNIWQLSSTEVTSSMNKSIGLAKRDSTKNFLIDSIDIKPSFEDLNLNAVGTIPTEDCYVSHAETYKGNVNDTIVLDDSVDDSNLFFVKSSSVECKTVEAVLNVETSNCHPNDTICIDDSFVMPTIKKEKVDSVDATECPSVDECDIGKRENKSESKSKMSEDKIADTSSNEESVNGYIESVIEKVKSSSGLKSEAKLRFELEVAFDEKQGINIVSISPLKTSEKEQPVTSRKIYKKKNIEKDISGMVSPLKIPNLSSAKNPCKRTKDTSDSKRSRKLSDCVSVRNDFKDVQMRLDMCNAQLLQALDLHDTTISSEVACIQSRDSIMPLNLCMRDKTSADRCPSSNVTHGKENVPCHSSGPSPSKLRRKKTSDSTDTTPKKICKDSDIKPDVKLGSATKIPIRKIPFDSRLPVSVSQKLSAKECKTPLNVKSYNSKAVSGSDKSDEVSKKNHHFCMVRNSISKVPQSVQRPASKKFKNVESPIAKYIGKPHVYTPLKTTHRCDGNVLFNNMLSAGKTSPKGSSAARLASYQSSPVAKSSKKVLN